MTRFYKLISILIHPILLPIIATLAFFILNDSPILISTKYKVLVIVTTATYLIPLLLLFILKRRKLINSYEVKNISERKIPILFMIVLFYILGKTLGGLSEIRELSLLFYGSSFSLSVIYFLFIKEIKTSIHLLGIGSFLSFIINYSTFYQTNLLALISILFILSGVIAHARLQLKAHTQKEVFLGFFIGFISQILVFCNTYFI